MLSPRVRPCGLYCITGRAFFYGPRRVKKINFTNERALRSRSLRDGSLPHKGRFATFVRSYSVLRASKRPLKISNLKSACFITPFGRWNQVNPTIFEICLLYENNNNKYSY